MLKSLDDLRKTADDCTEMAGVEPNRFPTVWIVKGAFLKDLDAIEREVEDGYVSLPVDADGHVIHVGDTCTCDDKCDRLDGAHRVCELSCHGGGTWYVRLSGDTWYDPDQLHHVQPPTAEDVLREFLGAVEEAMLKGYDSAPDEIFAEYAKRLQLKEER